MKIVECIRAHPIPPFFDRFPDFLCVQGLQIRNYLIPALPLVSSFLKKAATICHEEYKYIFFPTIQQYLISISVTMASHKQTSFLFH